MKHRGVRHRVDGYPVEDASKPLEVRITQRDISRGKPSACECAIAVAIKRIYGAKHVRVNATKIYVERRGRLLRLRTPKGILEQIELFDRTGDMGPGVYTIPLVSPAHALGTVHRSDRPPGLRGHHLRPLRKRDRPIYKSDEAVI